MKIRIEKCNDGYSGGKFWFDGETTDSFPEYHQNLFGLTPTGVYGIFHRYDSKVLFDNGCEVDLKYPWDSDLSLEGMQKELTRRVVLCREALSEFEESKNKELTFDCNGKKVTLVLDSERPLGFNLLIDEEEQYYYHQNSRVLTDTTNEDDWGIFEEEYSTVAFERLDQEVSINFGHPFPVDDPLEKVKEEILRRVEMVNEAFENLNPSFIEFEI